MMDPAEDLIVNAPDVFKDNRILPVIPDDVKRIGKADLRQIKAFELLQELLQRLLAVGLVPLHKIGVIHVEVSAIILKGHVPNLFLEVLRIPLLRDLFL